MQALGQVQRGSGEGSEGCGEGLGGFGAEVTFNRVLGEGSGEGLGGFGAETGHVQQGSGEGSGEGVGGFGAKPGQGSTGFVAIYPALSFAACFRKICTNKTWRLLGMPPKLFF